MHKHRLKSKYGLTPEQYDEMLTAQGNVCVREAEFYIGGTRFQDEHRSKYKRDEWVHSYAFYKEASYDQTKQRNDPTRVSYSYWEPADEIVHMSANFFDKSLQDLEEVLKEVFGDHVKVTYRDGEFTVEDYDHD